MELHERVNKIKTKQDLGQFVGALRADLATNSEQWENPTLDRFLEAMEAWIVDMEGYYKVEDKRLLIRQRGRRLVTS